MKGLVLLTTLGLLLALPMAAAVDDAEVHADPGFADCLKDVKSCAPETDEVEQAQPETGVEPEAGPGIFDRTGAFLGALGAAVVGGAGEAAQAVGGAFVGMGDAVLGVLLVYAGFLLAFRPEGMPIDAYAGIAAGGTAVALAGLQAGLWWLGRRFLPLAGLLMPLFSRIQKDEVLDHERRAQIFELIKQRPGVHLSEIARALDLAWGPTLHHLRKLREQRIVSIKNVGHRKCFFINGSGYSDQQMEAMSLLKSDTLAEVAAAIESHPDSSLKEVSESLGISSPLAAHHVRKLVKAGLVRKERDGRRVRLTPSELMPRGFFNDVRPHACAVEGAVGFA
jgi:DNA-binding MarR family transcriptional regulator